MGKISSKKEKAPLSCHGAFQCVPLKVPYLTTATFISRRHTLDPPASFSTLAM